MSAQEMEFIFARRIEDVLSAAIPPLAARLAASAKSGEAKPSGDGNGRSESAPTHEPTVES